tara:strand:+ start:99 stop:314 length:216 start_codon:yes stop_codon:yes gene_type:complete
MSKRITNTYKNFLEYSRRRTDSQANSTTKQPSSGLLARRSMPQNNKPLASDNFSELEKVAKYIENIRAYRN